ncbi:YqaJ domain-containing protein, partial [Aphis craccivora]
MSDNILDQIIKKNTKKSPGIVGKRFLKARENGLVGDTALFEIKFPLSTKYTIDIQVALDNNKIPYITIADGKMKLKKDSSYYYQVQE